MKGGGREDYFQNIRRTLEKISPAHLRTHRHTHTQIHELTDTDTEAHTHTHRYTNKQILTDTHKHTHRHKHRHIQTHININTQTPETHSDTHRQTHTETHRHTYKHTHRHTGRHAHTDTYKDTHTQHTQANSTAHHVIFLLLRVLSSEQPFAIRQLSSQHYQWDFWRKTNMGVHLLYFLICLVLLPQQLWQNLGDGSLQGPQCNQLRFPHGR